MFLLDTSVLSNAQKPKPLPTVQEWFRKQTRIAIPFPAFVEIEQGISEVRRGQPSKAEELTEWLDGLVATDYSYPPVTVEVARTLGKMNCCGPLKNLWYVNPQSKKEKRPGQDLFIAAIAIVHKLPVATLNERDFIYINRFFPLPGVYNPNAGLWAVKPYDGGKPDWGMDIPLTLNAATAASSDLTWAGHQASGSVGDSPRTLF